MFKKTMAMMLAAVMLLHPVMASAVTWGEVVDTLSQNGYGSYSFDDETSADYDEKSGVTVTGGTVSDVVIDNDDLASKYTFVDVTIDGETFGVWMNANQSAEIILDGETNVEVDGEVYVFAQGGEEGGSSTTLTVGENASVNAMAITTYAATGGTATIDNSGTLTAADVNVVAYDGGTAVGTNSGAITANNGLGVWANSLNEETGEYGEKATASFTNIGTIDGEGWTDEEGNFFSNEVYVNAVGDAETTFTNAADGEAAGKIDADVAIMGGIGNWEGNREQTTPEGSKYTINFTNEGTVDGFVNVSVWENGEVTTTNSAGAEITGSIMTDVNEENSVSNISNAGVVGEEIQVGAYTGTATVTNDGEASHLWGWSEGDAEVNVTIGETGSADSVWFDAYATTNVTNNGTVGYLEGGADESGALTITNNGTVSEQIYAEGWSGSSVTVTNTSDGSAEHIWVSGMDESNVSATNNGAVAGEFGAGAYGSSTTTIINSAGATAGSTWVDAYDNATLKADNQGEITGTVSMATDGNASLSMSNGANASVGSSEIYINTGSSEVLSAEQIAAIVANVDLAENATVQTFDEEGNITAVYAVNKSGSVTLVENFTATGSEQAEELTDGQKAWLEEQDKIARENHERELKRHAEAVGGVTASPEWVWQLFLGYMSLNLRMYENGEHILFREKLAWAGDGTKNLTLRVNIDEPQALTVRLDEVVLDKLEQAEISLITLLAKDGTPVMQYKVSDLRGAYEMYGLSGADLLVVGGADDEVMKIGADGQMVPVEQTVTE